MLVNHAGFSKLSISSIFIRMKVEESYQQFYCKVLGLLSGFRGVLPIYLVVLGIIHTSINASFQNLGESFRREKRNENEKRE